MSCHGCISFNTLSTCDVKMESQLDSCNLTVNNLSLKWPWAFQLSPFLDRETLAGAEWLIHRSPRRVWIIPRNKWYVPVLSKWFVPCICNAYERGLNHNLEHIIGSPLRHPGQNLSRPPPLRSGHLKYPARHSRHQDGHRGVRVSRHLGIRREGF